MEPTKKRKNQFEGMSPEEISAAFKKIMQDKTGDTSWNDDLDEDVELPSEDDETLVFFIPKRDKPTE
jgi:hypothetical protein